MRNPQPTPRPCLPRFLVAPWAVLLMGGLPAALHSAEPQLDRDVRPVLEQFCIRCHGPEKQKADLRLNQLDADLVSGGDAETWHDVLNKLNLGEMPPEDEPQPTEAQRQKLVGWLTGELKRAADARRSTGGRGVLRRLNRYEYHNTMVDLLGLELDFAKDLPPEPTSPDGFQNNGAALGMSPLQLEYYSKTARTALGKAIVTGTEPTVYRHHAEKTESTKRIKQATSNRLGPGGQFLVRLMEYPTQGEIRVRVRAGAIVPDGAGYPRMQMAIGVRSDTLAPERTLGEGDVTAAVDDPQTLEFRGRIEEFPLPGHNPKYPGVIITVRNVYDDGGGATNNKKPKKGKNASEDPTQPVIVVESLDFEGPVLESWPPPSHTRILFAKGDVVDETAYARTVLDRFMQRAFRRPVATAEVDVMMSLFGKVRPRTETLEEAMREVLAMVLISPEFLYLFEPDGLDVNGGQDATQSRRLKDFELASRLSYFLWSSMPDAELFDLARGGKLLDATVLAAQARRMIADPRSQNFVEQFTAQWLGLSGLDRVAVDPEYYPAFDDRLKSDMRQETLKFFAEVLYQDLSALNLIDSDFTMLNRRLARHYGLDGPRGERFERVALQPEDRRGGLLAQGSILLSNSTGEDSHPIRRAMWVLDRLLDDPPPPPPPDVPELKGDEPDLASLPLKRQLELHREKAACNSCHRGIDPWGIPFEHYDAVGQWRDEIRRVVGKKAAKPAPVVANSTLPSGHDVDGLDGLKSYLLGHERERFARALVKKMLTYALGRSLEWTDQEAIDSITKEFAANDYRLSDMIVAIVNSDAFQTK